MPALILSVGTAVPGNRYSQSEAYHRYLQPLFAVNPRARRIFGHLAIEFRHSVLAEDDLPAYFSGSRSTGERNAVFAREAPALGERAVAACLERADVDPDAVDHFLVTTCTGCITPGLDILLACRFAMRPDLKRTCIGGMGCYAVFPALNRAREGLAACPGTTALILAVELCTLHLQPTPETDNVVSTSLFADGAAAVLLGEPSHGAGPLVIDAHTRTDYTTAGEMTWELGDTGFRMSLSSYVPFFLATRIREFVETLLSRHQLTIPDIRYWAVHPGGPRILDAVQEQLTLTDRQMAPGREVLRHYGNMSSPTVLFVLDTIQRDEKPRAGDYGMMLGFGPGLTMEACLLGW